jgi:SMI1 / KNR4 family (SUKH-1)
MLQTANLQRCIMSLDRFDAHLRDPAPGFHCYAAGDKSEKLGLLVRVNNQIGPAVSAEVVAAVADLCGTASPVLTPFLERHDGVLLYCDSKSDAAGIEFFKATEWRSRTQEMRDSMAEMGFEVDDMPDWFHHGVVFGEIPHSANYFVIQPDGDEAGQIFYCDHDDFRTEPMAASFEEFLAMIVSDPPGFLYQCGCFTRYSDGKSKTQWIPKKYVPDCGV